jgi:NAD(P)H-hydrate epimerase
MIPLFSTEQIRDADSFAIKKLGIPSLVLMENAARSIFDIVYEKFLELGEMPERLGFICGKGNNGGDGFASARHFANEGFYVSVVFLGKESEMSEECKTNHYMLKQGAEENPNIKLKNYKSLRDLNILKNCDVIFDALLGSGMHGELREPYKSIVKKINNYNSYKIAIDIPTGLDSDKGTSSLVFDSDLTVTLSELKKGLFFLNGYTHAGEIEKGSIGIDERYFDRYNVNEYLIEPEDALIGLPGKGKSIHKYSAGKVLTIAGSGKLPGAAAFTSQTALKIGAGASILLYPKSSRRLIQPKLDEVILETYDDKTKEILSIENVKALEKRLSWADVLAIGPGLGREQTTQEAVIKILTERKFKKAVIDADAIFALSNKSIYKKMNLKDFVLTPHMGEFSNLISVGIKDIEKDILKYGKDFSTRTKAYLVLKGAPTIIFNPRGEAFINTTGNAGMAKFGTGDVLTGVLSGILSQTDNIEEAIITGVYLHSLSADIMQQKLTEYGYTAQDIMENLPFSIKFLRGSFA